MEELNELRKIAEAATPGPWTLEYENADDWEAGINDGDYPHTIHGPRNCSFDNWTDKSKIQDYLNRVTEISEMVDADAKFIATFDPPTVLALLSRLEQAERNADTYQKLYEQRAESLEQAEQAVARVREVLKTEAFDVREYVTYKAVPVEYIEEALDGDGRG